MTSVIYSLQGDAPYIKGSSLPGALGNINYSLDGPDGGDLVVFFHGLNSSIKQWRTMAFILNQRGFRTLIFDLWGHGLSAPIPSNPCKPLSQLFIEQVDSLLAGLKLLHHSVHVVGFSMGGYLAAEYAAREVSQVAKAILFAPAGLIPLQPKRYKVLKCQFLRRLVEVSLKLTLSTMAATVRCKKDIDAQFTYDLPEHDPVPRPMRDWRYIIQRNLKTTLRVVSYLPLWQNPDVFDRLTARRIPLFIAAGIR